MRALQHCRDMVNQFLAKVRSARFQRAIRIQLQIRPYLQGVPYWTAAAFVGFVAVIYGGAFSWCIAVAQHLQATHPYYLLFTCPLCLLFATWVVEKYAPPAGGTGIPEVTRALAMDARTQRAEIHTILNLRVAAVIVVSSLACMLGAGALGREGPMVQLGACAFYFVGRQFNRIWPYEEHRSWIVAGGAAGIAAAFNAPLAGVVFVLEELAMQSFHRFKTVVISATIVGGMVSQSLSGRYLYFGYPKLGFVPLSSLPMAALVGVVCGMVALPFHQLLSPRFQSRYRAVFKSKLTLAAFAGLLLALLAIFVSPGTIGGGVSVIQDLLFVDGHTATWRLIVGRFLATIISHLSGCAGGFLAPSLALGAAIGSKIATMFSFSNHNLLVMVGMASFLSAIIRAPFTAWVIVMEMTDRHQAIFPLMVASLIASATVRLVRERENPASTSEPPPTSTPTLTAVE